MKSPLTPDQLAILKEQLKHGDLRRIARMSNYSAYSVNLFFHGECYNDEIMEAIFKLIEKRKETANRIDRLFSKPT